jgi:aspartyl-tRNA(Asn)/glutamyl-tRNA(Gln) amidotransferase subunit C
MIDAALVKKLAGLSRLTLSDEEVETYAREMEKIVEYVGLVSSVELVETAPKVVNVFRDDAHPRTGHEYTEKLLNEAPAREGDYLKVKKIIEQ